MTKKKPDKKTGKKIRKKTRHKRRKKIKSRAKSIKDKRKESFDSFSMSTDEILIKIYSVFTEADLIISFDKIKVYMNPFNIIGEIKSIEENRPKNKLNEYGKSVVKYIKGKKKIDLLDLFDKGILFILHWNEGLLNGFNDMLLEKLTGYLTTNMNILQQYRLDASRSDIGGSLYFNDENYQRTSLVYKIHISVKSEYLFDALELFSQYPKLGHFPCFKIVFPKFQHSEYKNIPHFMEKIDNPDRFIREYEEITGATASANIVLYPFIEKDDVFEDKVLIPFMKFWNKQCDTMWARDHNYLWFNTRLGSSLYFAYGYDTASRLGCYVDNNESDCINFKITDNLKKLQNRYCENEDFSDDDMKCLEKNFNLNLTDLCDDSLNSIPNVWGTRRKMKEIKHVKNKCLTKKKKKHPTDISEELDAVKKAIEEIRVSKLHQGLALGDL